MDEEERLAEELSKVNEAIQQQTPVVVEQQMQTEQNEAVSTEQNPLLAANSQDKFTTKMFITILSFVSLFLGVISAGLWFYLNQGFSGELYSSDFGYSIELPEGYEVVLPSEDRAAIPSYIEGFRGESGSEIIVQARYSEDFNKDVERITSAFEDVETKEIFTNGLQSVQFELEEGDLKQVYTVIRGVANTLYILEGLATSENISEIKGSMSTFLQGSKKVVTNKCYSFELPVTYLSDFTDRQITNTDERVPLSSNCENFVFVTVTELPQTGELIFSEQGSNYVFALQTRISPLEEIYGIDTSIENIAATLAVIAQNAGSSVEMSEVQIDGVGAILLKTVSSTRHPATKVFTTSYLLLADIDGEQYGLDSDFLQVSYSDALGDDSGKVMQQVIDSWKWATEEKN